VHYFQVEILGFVWAVGSENVHEVTKDLSHGIVTNLGLQGFYQLSAIFLPLSRRMSMPSKSVNDQSEEPP
jgi:hypothetical protein